MPELDDQRRRFMEATGGVVDHRARFMSITAPVSPASPPQDHRERFMQITAGQAAPAPSMPPEPYPAEPFAASADTPLIPFRQMAPDQFPDDPGPADVQPLDDIDPGPPVRVDGSGQVVVNGVPLTLPDTTLKLSPDDTGPQTLPPPPPNELDIVPDGDLKLMMPNTSPQSTTAGVIVPPPTPEEKQAAFAAQQAAPLEAQHAAVVAKQEEFAREHGLPQPTDTAEQTPMGGAMRMYSRFAQPVAGMLTMGATNTPGNPYDAAGALPPLQPDQVKQAVAEQAAELAGSVASFMMPSGPKALGQIVGGVGGRVAGPIAEYGTGVPAFMAASRVNQPDVSRKDLLVDALTSPVSMPVEAIRGAAEGAKTAYDAATDNRDFTAQDVERIGQKLQSLAALAVPMALHRGRAVETESPPQKAEAAASPERAAPPPDLSAPQAEGGQTPPPTPAPAVLNAKRTKTSDEFPSAQTVQKPPPIEAIAQSGRKPAEEFPSAQTVQKPPPIEAIAQSGRKPAEEFPSASELIVAEGQASPIRELNAGPSLGQLRQQNPRIQPAPLPGGEVKAPHDIIFDIGKEVGRKVQTGGVGRGAAGTYYPGSARTSIRFSGDMDTASHELAHSLDDAYGIVANWAGPKQRSPFDGELSKFWGHGSSAEKGGRASLAYKRAEGVAEYIRARIVNPDEAKAAAPQFSAFFEQKVPAEVRAKLDTFSTQVRQWAGLDPLKRSASVIRMEPEPRPGVRAELKRIGKNQGYEFETTTYDRVKSLVQDDLWQAVKGVRAAKEMTGRELEPAKDPETLIRLLAGFNESFTDQLEKGPREFGTLDRAPGVGGLDWMLEPLKAADRKTMEADLRDAFALGISERTIERAAKIDRDTQAAIGELMQQVQAGTLDPAKFIRRADRLKRAAALQKDRLAGTGGGLYGDTKQAMDVVAGMKGDPAKLQRLSEFMGRYRQFADASVLKPMLDSGYLNQKQYDAIKADNQFYINMGRVMEEKVGIPVPMGSRRLGSSRKVLQKFQGSTRLIENPLTNLVASAYQTQREVARNNALRQFRDLLTVKRGMYQGEAKDIASIGSKTTSADANGLKIMVDGKAEYWKFAPDIHRALQRWGETDNSGVLDAAMRIPGRILRTAIIHEPGFAVRNVIRDAVNRGVISEHGSTPWDSFKPIDKAAVERYQTVGGFGAGHYLGDKVAYWKEARNAMKRVSGESGSILATPLNLGRGYVKLVESSELRGRMAEYRRAERYAKDELGYDDYNAALYGATHARGLIDYSVAGSIVRSINRYIPFTNAAVQGLARGWKGLTTNPAGFLARWGLYVMAPTLATWGWNASRGKDTEDEYLNLPDYQRDFFWNLKVADNTWLRIPKPFEMGVFASGVERAINATRGKRNAFDGYGGSLAKSLLPMDESVIYGPFKTAVELAANKNFYTGQEIVPFYEKDKPVAQRGGTDNASRIGQLVQKAIGIDARQADHFVNSQFGGFGKLATTASDVGRDDKPSVGRQLAMQATGVLKESPAGNSEAYQEAKAILQELGNTNAKPLERLRLLQAEHRMAQTGAERDQAAKALRDEAERVRPWLENVREMKRRYEPFFDELRDLRAAENSGRLDQSKRRRLRQMEHDSRRINALMARYADPDEQEQLTTAVDTLMASHHARP